MGLTVAIDDPRADDVRALLDRHLAFCREVTPAGHVRALEPDGLLEPDVTLFGARQAGVLLGVAALRRLDGEHAELKSMHTLAAARGRGIGGALVDHILGVAAKRGYRRVSLETGTMEAFAPARSLYAKAGFLACTPFGDYTANPHSVCMTIAVGR